MLSFQLPKEFVNQYSDRVPPFGFNGLGMVVFLRTYSRPKSDGTMESWADVCERVINGMYSIQKDHALENGRPWSEEKALRSATEAYDRMFNLKWTPSGRGLWMCGTPFVHERRVSEALLNCALITTEDIDQHRGDIFRWFMEMLMLGVGVGSDMKGSGKVIVRKPSPSNAVPYIIGDSREAWAKSVELLINSYIPKGGKVANEVNFDYSRIRPEGEPIKGFGGIASGPAPLIELHDRIREYMNRNDGRPLTSRTIADIFNAIGACVVSGNVRRSAEILFGDFDDDEFINLKNYEVNPDRQEIGWVSNNSLFAEIGSPYRKVAENIMRNGEPGFAWMENVRKYARMGDLKEDNADGFNPCKPLYSLILTPDGYITFDQALDRGSLRVVLPDGRVADASRPFKTGENREIIRIGLSDGTSIYATDNHLHMLLNGEWVETGSLKVGDVLKRSVVPVFDTSVDDVSRYEKGIVAGWIYGDGSVHKPSDRSSLVYQIYIGKNEFDFEDELSRMLGVDFRPHDQKPDTCKVARLHGNSHISWMIDEGYDLNKGNLTWLYGKDKDFKLGFIRGLFTTDGSVRRGNLVELYSVNREALEVVARILQEFGIVSNLTTHNRERSYVAKDGKVRNNKTTYKIAVHGGQFKKIGFLTKFKQDLLDSHEEKKGLRSADRLVVKEIEREYSYEDVYDITVHDHSHSFIDSSVVAHNCGEIALSGQREMCLLVEVYMNNHDDFYDYLRTLKFAYLYAKSISLTYEWISDPISRETMTSNRRIGLSNTGMAQFMSRNGVEKFIEWLDGGYDYVQHYDARYSGWLGVNRSIRTTTSKPSGSVSLLSGSTPGVHHPISEYYIRRVRLQSSSPLLAYLADCGFKTEADLYSDNTSVVEFPVHVGEGIKKEGDLSIWEQLEIAALVQRYWSDNSVSVTVKVDTDKVDADELARALSLYQYRLKSVSLLPTDKGAYEQMPYEEITKEQYDEMVSRIDFDKMNRIEKIMSGGAVAEEDKVTELYCTTDVCELPQMSS